MKHHVYTPNQPSYPICILVDDIVVKNIDDSYLSYDLLNREEIMILDLYINKEVKRTPVAEIKEYVSTHLVPVLIQSGVKFVFCSNAEYFKVLAGANKADAFCGYVCDSPLGDFKVIYIPSTKSVFYDPVKNKHKIKQGLIAYNQYVEGNYTDPGTGITSKCKYPKTLQEIAYYLDEILKKDVPISFDIEAYDLKFYKAGLGTICICWSLEEGIAFPIDYVPLDEPVDGVYGKRVYNKPVRSLLKNFFIKYLSKRIAHNVTFDASVLIYELFMDDILDNEGMLQGIEHVLKGTDCTKIISYLATNSCAGNKLSLKDQAQEFAGNYAIDEIKDITRIPLDKLLEYNVVDGLSTIYVYNKNHPKMVKDQQEQIYKELFMPAVVDIVQMQLTGLPIDIERTKVVNELMQQESNKALDGILSNPLVKQYTDICKAKWVEKRNSVLKVKRVTVADAGHIEFNPNSPEQLQELLYEMLELPVLARTDSKKPATGGSTLKALRNVTKNPDVLDLLDHLIDYKAVYKILTSVMPAFLDAVKAPDGWNYVFGFFNLGGTVSGRLSSNNINLQNIPVSGRLGSLVLSCVVAPPGWLFVGIDFALIHWRTWVVIPSIKGIKLLET